MKKGWTFFGNMASTFNLPFKPACLTDPLTESNCYIIASGSSALIIDPNNADLIMTYLEAHRLIPEYILLTHEHCDHIAGLNTLRSRWHTPVIASQACSDGIQDTKMNMTRMMESYLYFKSNGKLQVSYPKFTCQAAEITFDTPVYDFIWKEHSFRCIAVPGHTPGSTCIIVDGAILFSGDYFIPGEDVITRLPGGDEEAYQATGRNVLRALPEPIWTYPGHKQPFMLTQEVKLQYGL